MYNGTFLYPPRPKSLITPDQFNYFQGRGYLSQIKMNGSCAIVILGPKERKVFNRAGELMDWDMPVEMEKQLREWIDNSKWSVFVAELLHKKVKNGIRNTLYFHDVLILNGDSMVGKKYSERYVKILSSIKTGDGILIAENFIDSHKLFDLAKTGTEYEGIVMKNPNARLEPCERESANDFGVKCRLPGKNYSH